MAQNSGTRASDFRPDHFAHDFRFSRFGARRRIEHVLCWIVVFLGASHADNTSSILVGVTSRNSRIVVFRLTRDREFRPKKGQN